MHFIRTAIPLSNCCEVSANEHTLNLHSYHMQPSSLSLCKINLSAAHKFKSVTHSNLITHRTRKVSCVGTACMYRKIVRVIYYLNNLNTLDAHCKNLLSELFPVFYQRRYNNRVDMSTPYLCNNTDFPSPNNNYTLYPVTLVPIHLTAHLAVGGIPK
jgi:hypothetical protein